MEKRLDGNYTRMLRAILNRSWRQHPTKQQLYGHQPPITKTIQIRWTRHAGHCWRSRAELISDVLLWSSSHGRAKAGRSARTYIHQHHNTIIGHSLFMNIQNSITNYISIYHHHHVMPPAWIFLTLSRHPSLSSIAPSRSSRPHPVSAQSSCM